jgi:putative transposase
VTAFIDGHRERFGVEPICRTWGVSASAYYHRATGARSARQGEDERLVRRIREIHHANYEAYGDRRTWKALLRAGEQVGRCRVQRLMRAHGIQGAKRRGKPWRTTIPDPEAHRRPDLVQRNFTATEPNRLWVGDLSYLRCWEGIVYFAFRARCLLAPGGRLAARQSHAHRPGARRAADGARDARARR